MGRKTDNNTIGRDQSGYTGPITRSMSQRCQKRSAKCSTQYVKISEQLQYNKDFIKVQEALVKISLKNIQDVRRRLRQYSHEIRRRDLKISHDSIRFIKDSRVVEHPLRFLNQ